MATDRALGAAVLAIVLLAALALIGPLAWPHSATATDLANALQPPTADHPMGTDANGRDIFARFMRGAGISLAAGLAVVVAGTVAGGLVGLAGGLLRGVFDGCAMRAMDAVLAFPPLILAMAVTIGLGVGTVTACVGIFLATVPWYARLVRSDVLRISSLPFVEATRAVGGRPGYIARRHVLPHIAPTLLVQGAGAFGYTIIALASLGFVGLGAQVPTPEWGSMITDGMQFTLTGQWWIAVFPGIGLLIAVTAANVIADRLRARLDPRGDYVTP